MEELVMPGGRKYKKELFDLKEEGMCGSRSTVGWREGRVRV